MEQVEWETTTLSKRPRTESRSLQYTIDVLTDGSEYTGDGTLFLSVWKPNSTANLLDREYYSAGLPLARYAIAGLGDATSRLATDQRFKLSTVRAVLSVSEKSLWGLPFLQIALHDAGVSKLSVISTVSERVENITKLLESRRPYPTVRLCQIPDLVETQTQDYKPSWWQVYEDEFVRVHVRRYDATHSIYVVNLLLDGDGCDCLLISSPGSDPTRIDTWISHLPVCTNDLTTTLKLRYKIAIQPKRLAREGWYYTQPCNDTVDPNLLVRAQEQGRAWHDRQASNFPWNLNQRPSTADSPYHLRTGYTLLLPKCDTEAQVINRVAGTAQLDRVAKHDSWPNFVRNVLEHHEVQSSDDNEICLIDSDEEAESKRPSQKLCELLVLGTGCASPSPFRGSSGYALLFPQNVTVLFEAGEGVVTQWHRYADDRNLSSIQIIWISHAHWDHYGGLAPLLRAIRDELEMLPKHMNLSVSRKPEKRLRPTSSVPWVLAPRKVLKYLHLAFDNPTCFFNGVPQNNTLQVSKVFQNLELPRTGNRLVAFWENVPVEHSCGDAYGFVAGFHAPSRLPFTFCFSGDTRPCLRLLQTCRRATPTIDFLLHEATFSEKEKQMCIAKKHTTVDEAMKVQRDVRATRLLLTHFSQRYDMPPDVDQASLERTGFALDGLKVSLF
jgi:ribonuclease Z